MTELKIVSLILKHMFNHMNNGYKCHKTYLRPTLFYRTHLISRQMVNNCTTYFMTYNSIN